MLVPTFCFRQHPFLQDAKLAKLDNMDEDDLDKLREKRKAQLIAAQKIKQVSDGFAFFSHFLFYLLRL